VTSDAGTQVPLLPYSRYIHGARKQGEGSAVNQGPTCRDELLAAVRMIIARNGNRPFSPDDVIREMRARGTRYAESTIRTHVVSRMCSNAPDHHAATYDDLIRVGSGLYRLK
jgi:hypothetical protein